MDLEEEVNDLTSFKNTCVGIEEKVKSFMLISERFIDLFMYNLQCLNFCDIFFREMNILKTEVTALAESVEKTSMKGVLYETIVSHFECMKKQQLTEFEKARTVIVQKQCEIFTGMYITIPIFVCILQAK